MSAATIKQLTLGIHPARRGIGWIAFEHPLAPFDWGRKEVRSGDRIGKCVREIERLIARLQPETIVLEAFEGTSVRRARSVQLGRAIVALAASRGIDVALYSRADVKACFGSVGAETRQQVAEAIGRSLPMLAHKVPKPRKIWQSETHTMVLFSAAAIVLTHYQLGASRLFDDLSESRRA